LVTQALYALGFLFVMSLPLMSMILISSFRLMNNVVFGSIRNF
jgi:hypothetical protein